VTQDIPQNINFAIKSTSILSFLQTTNVTPNLVKETQPKSSPEIAAWGKAISAMVVCQPAKTSTQAADRSYSNDFQSNGN